MKATALRAMLSGGDLRSTGLADQAATAASLDPEVAEALFSNLNDSDALVRMRSADALEKFTRKAPEFLARHRDGLLALLCQPQPKEVRWHLLQMVSRVTWPKSAHEALLAAIMDCFSDASSIVRTSALQALHDLRSQGRIFEKQAGLVLKMAESTGTPAMRARLRKLTAKKIRAPRAPT